ncbi:MAG: hypothetical protein NVS4B11_30510 [Ktedonobacteraceae bacterium]
MSEQEQQDVDSEHNVCCIDDEKHKEPEHVLEHAAKTHRVKRRRKRHRKRSRAHSIHDTPQVVDVAEKEMPSQESVPDEVLHEEQAEIALTDTPLPQEVQEEQAQLVTHAVVESDASEQASTAIATETIVASPPALEETIEAITDTPLPPALEETIETITDTPLPLALEEVEETLVSAHDTDPATPAVSVAILEPVVPTTPSIAIDSDTAPSLYKPRRLSRRTTLVYALLTLLLSNTLLLWQDLTETHLYVNTIDVQSGKAYAQHDLGGYHDSIHLTAPLPAHKTSSAPVLLGAYADNPQGTQQILTLDGAAATISLQRSIPRANGAITVAPNGHLLVESAHGMQVVTEDGRLLWQVHGEQPTQGVHHFQPASDATTVYTVKSVKPAQVAAYDLLNGRHTRWVQTLDDTLDYAPPFLLDGETLYVASDHNVFAINTHDGTVRWKKSYPSRTLLLENEGQTHLLIALGARGVQALQGDTGDVVWSLQGEHSNSQSPTQFYQGSIGRLQAANGNIIYATGVVWKMPNVQEQVWLSAITASTGKLRWSRQVASGLVGVDAGRIYQPFFDMDSGIVVLQHVIDREACYVTAYNANTGAQRWNTRITSVSTSSPVVFRASHNNLVLFTTTTDSKIIFWTPSLGRTCMLLLLLVSGSGLLWLLFLPRKQGIQRLRSIVRGTSYYKHIFFTQIRRYRHYARTLSVLSLLLLCIGAGIFAYTRSSQSRSHPLATDAQGSIVISSMGDNVHQLEALTPNGTVRWKLFSSEGTFSLPKTPSQVGTLLVALHGRTTLNYLFAGNDPAYPHPLDHMLTLYLLNRTTGYPLWQQIVSYPDEQQDAAVIGADTRYIYIVGEQSLATQANTGAKSIETLQLFAVNQTTGTVDWRIFGSSQPEHKRHITSTLLLKNGQALWQIGRTVYTIDTSVGQIIGRK